MSSRTDFQSRLLNRWAKIKPLAKDVVTEPNGSPKDIYFEGDLADVLAQGIATALYESASYGVVEKLNELIDQYNQLRTDIITAAIPTTATAVTKLTR